MTPPNAKAVNRRLGGGEAMTPSLPRSPRNDLAATKETPSKVAQREDKLVRVATLLGTYSLGAQGGGGGEGSPSVAGRSGAGSGGEKDAVARCSASALRALLCGPSSSTASSSSRGDDSGTTEEDRSRPRPPPSEPSSFPSLMLDSDPHHHHHHHHAPYSEDKREVEVLASSNLARPVLLLAVPVPVPASFSSRKAPAPASGTNSSQVSCGTTHDSADKSTTARDSAVKSDKSNANQSDDTAGRSTDGAEDFKNTALRRSTDSVAETTVDFKEDKFGRQDTVNNTSGHEPNPSRGVSPPDGTPSSDSCSGASAAALTDPASIPPLLLRNLCSSFALLVGARLRAYGTILAGHAASMLEGTDGGDLTPDDCDDDYGGDGDRPTTPAGEDGDNVVGSEEEEEEEEEEQYKEGGECSSCLGAAETKLTALVKIGEGVGVDAAVTAMRASTAAARQRKAGDGDKRKVTDNAEANADDEAVRLPLTFEAVVDVGVPNLVEGRRDVLSVSIEAPGTIEGNFLKADNDDGARLSFVRVELDTHILLASMIERACEVVARAVENVAAAAAVAASSPCALEVHRAKEEEGVDKDADACNEDRDASSPKNNDVVDGDGDENDAADRAAMPPPEPRAPSVVSPDLRALIPAKRSRAEDAASAADDDAGRDPSPLDLLNGPSAPTPSSEEAAGAGDEDEDEDSSERCAAIVDYIMEEVVDACPSWLKNPFPPCKRARRGSGSRPAMPAPAQAQE